MKGVKGIFDSQWELRTFVILSTILQVLLIFWTFQRKRISSRPIRIVWLVAFPAADSIAALCVGVIFHVNMSTKASDNPHDNYLLAMWAPFMLLHLGRHSRITAFSLGENEFWFGHLIRFIYVESIALIICFLAWSEQRFHYISSFLFIMGTIKYGERVLALKFGSLNELRSFNNFKEANANVPGIPDERRGEPQLNIDIGNARADEVWSVADVYQCFNKYKGIYTDIIFTSGARDENERNLTTMDTTRAFKFMEIELSFAYDLFYTKSVCSDTVWGWIARGISLLFIYNALGLFTRVGKQGFLDTDVGITYFLLITALILELGWFVEFIVSNTTVLLGLENIGARRRNLEGSIRRIQSFVEVMKTRLFPAPQFSLGQFNLLQFCFNDQKLRPWQKWVLKFFEVKEFWDNYHYTTYSPIDHGEIRSNIINRVEQRLREERADTFFFTPIGSSLTDNLAGNKNFHEFERCLLVWHLSTDLCHRSVDQPCLELQNAKILSDYMLYLLVLHPSLLSPLMITTEFTSYQDLCAELVKFYSDPAIGNDGLGVHRNDDLFAQIIQRIRWGTDSLLQDGVELSRQLKEMWENNGGDNTTWDLVFEVWVDMLSFAACWSSGKQHAELLGKGEELITYVRLFMSHCYSVDQIAL